MKRLTANRNFQWVLDRAKKDYPNFIWETDWAHYCLTVALACTNGQKRGIVYLSNITIEYDDGRPTLYSFNLNDLPLMKREQWIAATLRNMAQGVV